MAPSTPSTPDSGPAKKPGARKSPARKPAAKAAAAKAQPKKADAVVTPDSQQPVIATPDPEPAASTTAEVPTPEPTPAGTAGSDAKQPAARGSILDSVRANAVGPLAVGLVVAIAVGLLLSVLVPSDPNLLAMIILGTLLAAAVGFAVRLVSLGGGLRNQIEAFVMTVVGVHVMSVTGALGGDFPLLARFGVSGPGFDDAFLASLAVPPVSSGGLIAGAVAAIIVGWRSHSRV